MVYVLLFRAGYRSAFTPFDLLPVSAVRFRLGYRAQAEGMAGGLPPAALVRGDHTVCANHHGASEILVSDHLYDSGNARMVA